MDMGILKPFELGRTASSTGASAEAGLSSRPSATQAQTAHPNSASSPVEILSPLAVEQPTEVEDDTLRTAVADMQNFVQSVNRDINFQLDDSSGRVVISVTERSSGNVIRQIPSEEALRLSENLAAIRTLLFKAEA